jgi:hypothetical protein
MLDKVLDRQGLIYYDAKTKEYIEKKISNNRKYCLIGSGSTGWYKVASQTMGTYSDTNITFMVTSTYDRYASGILQFQIRSGTTSLACKTLHWDTRIGFNTDDVICVVNGMTYTIYVNYQSNSQSRIMFEVMSESSLNTGTTDIELYNSKTPESSKPVATMISSDGATVNTSNQVNQIVLTNENLDDIKPENFLAYYAAGNNTIINNPFGSGSAFGLIAYKNATGYKVQEITSLYGVKKIRYYNNSTWSEWKTFAYGEDYFPKTGGIINGDILPETALSNNLGSSTAPFNNIFSKTIALRGETSGQSYGALTTSILGTTDTDGITKLVLGNYKTSGTENNSKGVIEIYGSRNGKAIINNDNGTTNDVTLSLPDKSGTLALISEVAPKEHTHDGYTNQNAISKVKVGDRTISATNVQDTLELVAGSNVTISADVASKKITISSTSSGGGSSVTGDYLPLDGGGTVKGDTVDLFKIKRTSGSSALVGFENTNGVLGYIGMGGTPNGGLRRLLADTSAGYAILDENNMGNYIVPKTGGKYTGSINIQGSASSNPLQTRAIVGSDGTDTIGDLYLQYGANSLIKLGNEAKYTISADGGNYSGNSATATALTSSAGNSTTPVYFKEGKPVACDLLLDNYLLKSGGILENDTVNILTIKRTSGGSALIGFENSNGLLGYIGMNGSTPNGGLKRLLADSSAGYMILDESNYKNYTISRTGDSIEGTLKVANLSPVAALTNNLGTSTSPFNVEYIKTIALRGDTSGQSYGALTVNTVGTPGTEGLVKLTLGNNISYGNDKNASGLIEIYDRTGKTTIKPDSSSDNVVKLPSKSGILALISDIPIKNSYYANSSSATKKVKIEINGSFLRYGITGQFTNIVRISSNGCSSVANDARTTTDILCSAVENSGSMNHKVIAGDANSIAFSSCSWSTSVSSLTTSNETVTFYTYVGGYSWLSIQHSNQYAVTITEI